MTALIQHLGLLGVFLLMVPESACVPIPSEATLLFAGFAVSQHWMSFPLAVAAATAGNVVGSLIAYALGRTRLVPSTTLAHLLADRPLRSVFVARLLPLARTFVSLPAGARRVPIGPFIVLTAAGCAIWATALTLTGTLSGSAWTATDSVLGKALLAGGAAAVIVLWLSRRRRSRSGR